MNNAIENVIDTELSLKENSWKNIGTDVTGLETATECINKGNLNFEVTKRPLKVSLPGGILVTLTENYATIRTDTYEQLGLVGDRYKITQNEEVFNFFDELIQKGIAKYETVGKLGKGERIFLTAKFNTTINVNDNETVDLYAILTNSHDTISSLSFFLCPIFQNNVLSVSLKGKNDNRITIRHTENLDTTGLAKQILNKSVQYIKQLSQIYNEMADTLVDESVYERIIVHALADTPAMEKAYLDGNPSTRFKGIVNRCMEYALNGESQTLSSTKGTLFGAFNAVSGYHQNVIQWDDEEDKTKQFWEGNNRLANRIQKAFNKSLSFIKKVK